MAKYKTVKVQVPEIQTLGVDPVAVERLDSLCLAAREIQDQVKGLEITKKLVMDDLKPLAESLGLPERVLGEKWDLRKVERVTSRISEDRLKDRLLRMGLGLEDVKVLVADCTETTTSTSWSVYGRDKSKEAESSDGG